MLFICTKHQQYLPNLQYTRNGIALEPISPFRFDNELRSKLHNSNTFTMVDVSFYDNINQSMALVWLPFFLYFVVVAVVFVDFNFFGDHFYLNTHPLYSVRISVATHVKRIRGFIKWCDCNLSAACIPPKMKWDRWDTFYIGKSNSQSSIDCLQRNGVKHSIYKVNTILIELEFHWPNQSKIANINSGISRLLGISFGTTKSKPHRQYSNLIDMGVQNL